MQSQIPKNDDKYHWTNHVVGKLRYYGLSASLVKRIIRFPERIEEGIADGTTAVMRSAGSVKSPQEIWVMYQIKGLEPKNIQGTENLKTFLAKNASSKKIIISAWRYPGVTEPNQPIFIPDDVLQELQELL